MSKLKHKPLKLLAAYDDFSYGGGGGGGGGEQRENSFDSDYDQPPMMTAHTLLSDEEDDNSSPSKRSGKILRPSRSDGQTGTGGGSRPRAGTMPSGDRPGGILTMKKRGLSASDSRLDRPVTESDPPSDDSRGTTKKSVAIDTTQNKHFTHRLLPIQSPEFDNVINQVCARTF